jgi:hypothetical protein
MFISDRMQEKLLNEKLDNLYLSSDFIRSIISRAVRCNSAWNTILQINSWRDDVCSHLMVKVVVADSTNSLLQD